MTTPSRYLIRTGKVEGMEIVPFRDDLINQAMDKGRGLTCGPDGAPPLWWPALAPLKKDERVKVREDLQKERQNKKSPISASTPL